MSPPINLDGDTVDAITMDGDSVSEVTVDGSAVFSAIPDSGVLRYDFEDDSDTTSFVDSFENGNTGTNQGGTFDTDSKFGSFALRLNGSSAYGEYPTVNETGPSTEWSVSMFLSLDQLPPDSGNNNDQYYLWEPRAEYSYAIVVGAGRDVPQGEIALLTFDGSLNYLQSGVTASTTSFLQIGAGHNGSGSYDIVTGGTIQANGALPDPNSVSDTNVIGAQPAGAGRYTDGVVDRFDIYPKQLSSAEWSDLGSGGDI